MLSTHVLDSTTCLPAPACGPADRKGRIAVGHDADLIAVPGNPLRDPNTPLDVRAAITTGGAWRHVAERRVSLGDVPRSARSVLGRCLGAAAGPAGPERIAGRCARSGTRGQRVRSGERWRRRSGAVALPGRSGRHLPAV
ncbi:amidohydrolase family protein [Streptomyces sp. BE147]|nr:amidohydrolase family protein [Streptomyces sp. BE147]